MRAWLLLLAVLATFKPIVQVASTEDLSTRFITAISTRSSATTTTSTALAVPFNAVVLEDKTTSASSSSATASSSAATSLLYKNSNSDSDSNSINKSDENLIIEIKNIEESEGVANENSIISPVQENKRTTQVKQLENLEKKHKVKTSEKALQSNRFEAIFSTAFPATFSSSDTTASSKTSQSSQTVMAAEDSEKSLIEEAAQEQHALSSSSISSSAATVSSAEQHHHNEHRHRHHHQQQSDNSAGSDAAAEADDDSEAEHETFSNKEVISEKLKPDPSTLVEIENSLLSLFNMKRPPKIDRSKIVIPEAMKQLYAQIMGHDIDSVNIPKPGLLTKSANTVRSFTHLDSKIDERFPHHHRFRLHFDVKSIPAEEKLKAAELQLSRKAISHTTLNPRLATRTRYQVLVYDITRLGIRGKREPTYLLLDNKTIRLNSTDTISLDVQPAVDRWLETPKKNYGLLIEVRTFRALKPAPHHHVRLRRSADETHDDWQHRQPLLFTYTDDGRHKSRSIRDVSTRSKRAGHHRRPHRRKNNEEICRRQSLYVDFTDVGWSDWIVAPPGYDAYYCHGKCPFPLAEHLNSTNHAVVQTLVNNLNPGKVPKACCVPTQLTGISMLYLNDQSTVVLKNYQDMTVVGCGCR